MVEIFFNDKVRIVSEILFFRLDEINFYLYFSLL